MNNEILALIDKYLPCSDNSQMIHMVNYSIQSGGKRIRPLLMLECAEQLHGIDSNIERLAVALELMHSYSLVHDDLPCMDDDDYRRGMLSCHKKFGYAEGVLTGDYLLNCCGEILFGGSSSDSYMTACRYLFDCGRHMIEGQIVDIHSISNDGGGTITLEQYDYIAVNKTGALLSASLVIPVLYYTMSGTVVENLKKVASLTGILYQIADDLSEQCEDECSILQVLDRESAELRLAQIGSEVTHLLGKLQGLGIVLPMLSHLVDKLILS